LAKPSLFSISGCPTRLDLPHALSTTFDKANLCCRRVLGPPPRGWTSATPPTPLVYPPSAHPFPSFSPFPPSSTPVPISPSPPHFAFYPILSPFTLTPPYFHHPPTFGQLLLSLKDCYVCPLLRTLLYDADQITSNFFWRAIAKSPLFKELNLRSAPFYHVPVSSAISPRVPVPQLSCFPWGKVVSFLPNPSSFFFARPINVGSALPEGFL